MAGIFIGIAGVGATSISIQNFLLQNLLPVTLGNIVGGAGLVGILYYGVYRLKR